MSTSEIPRPDEGPAAPQAARPSRPTSFGASRNLVAAVVASLLVGGGVVFAVDHRNGSSAPASAGGLRTPAAAQSGFGSGPPSGSSNGGVGGGGPVSGEAHVTGTVTATTGSSVTVKSTSGTATYTVNATSEVVRNGQSVSLSDIRVGDPVLVHVFPSASGKLLVERLFAGSFASDGGGFGPPPTGSSPPITGSST